MVLESRKIAYEMSDAKTTKPFLLQNKNNVL